MIKAFPPESVINAFDKKKSSFYLWRVQHVHVVTVGLIAIRGIFAFFHYESDFLVMAWLEVRNYAKTLSVVACALRHGARKRIF